MNKNTILTAVAFACLLLASCGTVKSKKEPDFHFNKQTTFTINYQAREDDKSNTVKDLEYVLTQNGFNVVSIHNAEKAVNHPNEILLTKDKKQTLEMYSVKDLNSVYSIELNYSYYYDVFYYSYTDFYARIADIYTDKTVMVVTFKGDKSIKTVLKKIGELLAKEVK